MAVIRNLSLLPKNAKDIASILNETEIANMSSSKATKEYQIAGMKMNIIDIKFMHNLNERPLDCHKIDESALKPAFGVKKDSDAPKLSKADKIK
jgi:hypothetical protein